MATRHRFSVDGEDYTVQVEAGEESLSIAFEEEDSIDLDVVMSGVPGLVSMVIDGKPTRAYVTRSGAGFSVTVDGRTFDVQSGGAKRGRGPVGGGDPPGKVLAPLTGVVVEIRVAVGDTIEAGQPIVIVEAMKMQNEVQAQSGGVVTAIHVEPGDRADGGDLLIEYDPSEE